MKDETKKWIEKGEADLKRERNSLASKDFYASSFWAQQAVEKILKAFIMKKENKLIKMHDLVILGRKAKLPIELLSKCERLSKAYIESRYGLLGGEIPAEKFKQADAENFLNIAEEITIWLKKKI